MKKLQKYTKIKFNSKEIEILKLISRLNLTIPDKILNEYQLTVSKHNISEKDIKDLLRDLGEL